MSNPPSSFPFSGVAGASPLRGAQPNACPPQRRRMPSTTSAPHPHNPTSAPSSGGTESYDKVSIAELANNQSTYNKERGWDKNKVPEHRVAAYWRAYGERNQLGTVAKGDQDSAGIGCAGDIVYERELGRFMPHVVPAFHTVDDSVSGKTWAPPGYHDGRVPGAGARDAVASSRAAFGAQSASVRSEQSHTTGSMVSNATGSSWTFVEFEPEVVADDEYEDESDDEEHGEYEDNDDENDA